MSNIFIPKGQGNVEYFDPVIDESEARADSSLTGFYFHVPRYIRRVGYRFEPKRMNILEVEEEENELLLNVFRLAIWQHRDLEHESVTLRLSKGPGKSPTNFSFSVGGIELDDDEEQLAQNLLRIFRARKFPGPRYQARGTLATKKRCDYDGPENPNWRRIWFIDFKDEYPCHEEVVVKITGTRQFSTGKHYPPSGGYNDWSGEYDYEPGGLSPRYYQTLFECDHYYKSVSGWRISGYQKLVHPNDLIPLREGTVIIEE